MLTLRLACLRFVPYLLPAPDPPVGPPIVNPGLARRQAYAQQCISATGAHLGRSLSKKIASNASSTCRAVSTAPTGGGAKPAAQSSSANVAGFSWMFRGRGRRGCGRWRLMRDYLMTDEGEMLPRLTTQKLTKQKLHMSDVVRVNDGTSKNT